MFKFSDRVISRGGIFLVTQIGEVVAEGEDDFSDFACLLACGVVSYDDGLFGSDCDDAFFALGCSERE